MTPAVVPVRYRHLGGLRWPVPASPVLSKIPLDPLVSCLCVTENRHAFMPWVLWNFDRQAWKRRELIIVDSSDPPVQIPNRKDVRVIPAPPGSWLGKKRNLALDAARGQVVAWFDDDDWQHPWRLSFLIPLLRKAASEFGASFIGPSRSFFVDLQSGRCQPYKVDDYAIFNGSLYYTEMVRHARFRENVLRNEDTLWIARLLRSRRGAALEGEHPTLFLWLTHDANISNQRTVRRCKDDGSAVLRATAEAWSETPRALAALKSRLQEQPAKQPVRALRAESARRAFATDQSPTPAQSPEPSALSRPSERVAALPKSERIAHSGPPRAQPKAANPRPSLALYAISDDPAAPLQSGFSAQHLAHARFGSADALLALSVQRRQEWANADYVGWFDARFVGRVGLSANDLRLELERAEKRYDVYAPAAERRSLSSLLGRAGPHAEAAFRHLLVQRLGKSATLLDRALPIGQSGFVVRPEILTRYVRDWLVPARTCLADRSERELRSWLGPLQPRERLGAQLLSLLASVFFHAEGCSFRRVELR